MKEKWTIWNTNIPDGQYELIRLQQDWDGLYMLFDDEKKSIEVRFKEGFLALRSCDESDRWKTIGDVLSENGGKFFVDKLIFEVENSEFKEWFIRENMTDKYGENIKHYAFVTVNDVIDILALGIPFLTIKDLK